MKTDENRTNTLKSASSEHYSARSVQLTSRENEFDIEWALESCLRRINTINFLTRFSELIRWRRLVAANKMESKLWRSHRSRTNSNRRQRVAVWKYATHWLALPSIAIPIYGHCFIGLAFRIHVASCKTISFINFSPSPHASFILLILFHSRELWFDFVLFIYLMRFFCARVCCKWRVKSMRGERETGAGQKKGILEWRTEVIEKSQPVIDMIE